MNRKIKTKTAQLYGASLNPARLWGVEKVVKGRDNRRKERAALDNIFNAMPPSVFFTLDNAVGVIDRITECLGFVIHNLHRFLPCPMVNFKYLWLVLS